MERDPYTLQCFRDVTVRRMGEARGLLDIPKKWCDGAVTYALLASECALKATLLFGYQANDTSEVPEAIRKQVFQSKLGHDLAMLWRHQAPLVQSNAPSALREAISYLHDLDRYMHRYGAKRPIREHAKCAIEQAEVVVSWMRGVVA